MITHFDKMDTHFIKNIAFRYTDAYTMCYYENIANHHEGEIEYSILPWIREEFNCRCLLRRELWRPFRDTYDYGDTYLGYKKLFLYKPCMNSKQYYYQLVINPYYGHPDTTEEFTCFELALYGWKEENDTRLYPIERGDRNISLDNIMPEVDWTRSTYDGK